MLQNITKNLQLFLQSITNTLLCLLSVEIRGFLPFLCCGLGLAPGNQVHPELTFLSALKIVAQRIKHHVKSTLKGGRHPQPVFKGRSG